MILRSRTSAADGRDKSTIRKQHSYEPVASTCPHRRRRHTSVVLAPLLSSSAPPMACCCYRYLLLILLTTLLVFSEQSINAQLETSQPISVESAAGQQQQSQIILPTLEQRPNVNVNIRDWTKRLGEELSAVGSKTNCVPEIKRFYANEAEFVAMDAAKMRNEMLSQINELLNQHKLAVNNIVSEAERLVATHNFVKTLRFNYTDVHRLRNELDPVDPNALWSDNWGTSSSGSTSGGASASVSAAASAGSSAGTSGGERGNSAASSSGGAQYTSINGGTPVPGPLEWLTPIRSLIMKVNKNFGDIPVNTSTSAVHLPLPIYPGLPEIMNGIAWSDKLDTIFRRNLATLSHIHHQCYGDHLGFLRTFPAHKWRIPRADPDLFDARVRPWYIAGTSAPKDVVILVDTSGSMTGLRREIAKGVVFEILDTLTNNDHFAVLRFSESVTPVGLPKCNLRAPKMGPALQEQCRLLPEYGGPGLVGYSSSVVQSIVHECHMYQHAWETRGAYLRDHPEIVEGKNGSYLWDDLYLKSIANVTNEIEDAYLLPATSRNIRYLKSNFTMPTAGIANFTNALMAAFELLAAYNRTTDLGSHCNQAIMLITDGAIHSHEDIFNRFNYPNSPVRLFSYMIGREVGDISATKRMACNNRGYYTHVINLAEVREQVQKYLAVMARPLVLSKQHRIAWTHVYGDETYQVLTDWVLEIKRRERARIMLNEERERLSEANSSDVINIELTKISEYDDVPLVGEQLKDRIICENMDEDDTEAVEKSLTDEIDPLGYNDLSCHWTHRRADLLTSVVKPVFDLRNTTLVFERVLHKNIWTERETHVKNAQLLGVAAVDLRINDIMQVAPSHLLGPNGYAFLMGQNGFLLSHPDFRALLEDPFDKQSKILKPHFASVDLTQVEQVAEPSLVGSAQTQSSFGGDLQQTGGKAARRPVDEQKILRDLRELMLKREEGFKSFHVKRTTDCRKRLQARRQSYYYGPIKDTPFSFAIVLPQNYSQTKLVAKMELSGNSLKLLRPADFDMWTVHPEYRYCEGTAVSRDTSDRAILDVLEAAAVDPSLRIDYDDLTNILVHDSPQGGGKQRASAMARRMVCDRQLFPSLLFDAAATESSSDESCGGRSWTDPSRSTMARIHGIEIAFLATRSGLTRVRKFDPSQRVTLLAKLFIRRHSRAIDESWYSRAIDYNMRFNEEATIISAPFNAYVRLIAKLRQRITQRAPAANDKRSNCDPSLVAEGEDAPVAGATSEPASSESPGDSNTPTTAATSAPSDAPLVDEASMATAATQNDEPSPEQTGTSQSDASTLVDLGSSESFLDNYTTYSTYDFLDLIANSSVHISAVQAVVVNGNGAKQRSAPVVAGILYDYSTFARRFLNTTSLDIRTTEPAGTSAGNGNAASANYVPGMEQPFKINICPDGRCPSRCGFRNDTIDCLLIDNNGFIIVGEELVHIGRSLVDYDEKLMASLVDRRIFNQVTITDYQAICSRTAAEVGAPASAGVSMASVANSMAQITSSSSPLSQRTPSKLTLAVMSSLVQNFINVAYWFWSSLWAALVYQSTLSDLDHVFNSMDFSGTNLADPETIGRHIHLSRSPINLADAQSSSSAVSNQSLLAQLPNKTYLRPCEKQLSYFEARSPILVARQRAASANDAPEYYVTKCNCSGWYVYDFVPQTNLIMLIVNTSSECRRGCSTSTAENNFVPVNLPAEPVAAAGPNAPFVINNKSQEDQVCAMLERDSQLYVRRAENCVSQHPDEAQIHICGSAFGLSQHVSFYLLLFALLLATLIAT